MNLILWRRERKYADRAHGVPPWSCRGRKTISSLSGKVVRRLDEFGQNGILVGSMASDCKLGSVDRGSILVCRR